MPTDEEVLEIGLALEKGGLSHSQIDEYFDHAGVKGMKWGQRKKRQKVGLVVGAYGGASLGANIAARTRIPFVPAAALTVTSGVLGYKGVKAFLDRHGDKKVSELPNHRGA